MKRTIQYQAEQPDEGKTIAEYLRARGYSRHVLSCLKRFSGGFLCNGVPAFSNQALHAGDILSFTLTEPEEPSGILPVEIPLDILYEDEDILVLNKQADLPSLPAIRNHEHTLANAVTAYYLGKGEPGFTYRCINRLDRDTTGTLIIARHMAAASILSAQLQRREIHREYLAVTEGLLPESGTICAPIGRAPGSVIARCVDETGGEHAVTHFTRIFTGQAGKRTYSVARVRLETGRTHQIRVHMAHIGHPLLGDFLYNPRHTDELMGRQALHAWHLSFMHPVTGSPMHVTAPVPEDLQKVLPPHLYALLYSSL